MPDVQPDARAVRRMLRRLARDGLRLPEALATPLAAALAAPVDRGTMLQAAAGAAVSLKQAGHAATQDMMLEAAAAVRGDRDWNALAGRLPTAAEVETPQSSDAVFSTVRDATAWLVHHAHHRAVAGRAPLCTGPFPSLQAATREFESYQNNHLSHLFRLLRWHGPFVLLDAAQRAFAPGSLLLEAEHGKGHIEVLRQRRGDGLELGIDGVPVAQGNKAWDVRVRPSLDALQQAGLLTGDMASLLRKAVAAHHRILVLGRTGAGKTLLVNALATAVPPHERIHLVEKVPEIVLHAARAASRSTALPSPGAASLQARWLIAHEVRAAQMRDAIDASDRALGTMFGVHGSAPGDAAAAEEMLAEVQSWHRPGAPPALDLIICLDLSRARHPHQWVSACWVIGPDWSLSLIAKDGERVELQSPSQGMKP